MGADELESFVDLEEFKASLDEYTQGMGVEGEFCEYGGDRHNELICPGMDSNCLSTKQAGCELFRGYKTHGGILDYLSWQVAQLGSRREEFSELARDLEDATANLRSNNFLNANKYLENLATKIEEANNNLRKLVRVLSS